MNTMPFGKFQQQLFEARISLVLQTFWMWVIFMASVTCKEVSFVQE